MSNKVDFVITWVDGSDVEWQREREKYLGTEAGDSSEVRFRDWDNLRYWFRAIEKYAPWVNKIHFVTYGHIPEWLDTSNERINIVEHKDILPAECLPTFSSRAIELNIFRIHGLSEQFVYFNDDMFVNGPVTPQVFFKNHMPRDSFGLNPVHFSEDSSARVLGNILTILDSKFDYKECKKKNFFIWYNPCNGLKNVIKTLLLSPWPWAPGFYYSHLPESYLKSECEEVWKNNQEVFEETSRQKFRTDTSVNQWIFKFWRFMTGHFIPISTKRGKCFHLYDDDSQVLNAIRQSSPQLICINDTKFTTEWEIKKERIKEEFEKKYPEKSSFEK